MSLSTPVVFIIFNRPDTTARVFEAIRQAEPAKLLVVADGARKNRPNEVEKCAATRAVIDRVDWDCEVITNYSDINLGCKHRVASGIDWVFSQVEEAIILEDDCLPAPSFFQFCQTLLEKYRDDERIMMISGDNFSPEDNRVKDSYYFSKYAHIWGWATWQRAWQHYDVNMSSWPEFRDRGLINNVCSDPVEAEYWLETFNNVAENLIDTWDHQWVYTCWQQSGMSIMPTVNLISNIGFRDDATHTVGKSSPWAEMKVGNIYDIIHPTFILNDRAADIYMFEYLFGGKALKFDRTIYGKVIQFARNIKRVSRKT
jgi:hypothetical protein